jgi:hypothetical protein
MCTHVKACFKVKSIISVALIPYARTFVKRLLLFQIIWASSEDKFCTKICFKHLFPSHKSSQEPQSVNTDLKVQIVYQIDKNKKWSSERQYGTRYSIFFSWECGNGNRQEDLESLDGIILSCHNGGLKCLPLFLHHSILHFGRWLLLIRTWYRLNWYSNSLFLPVLFSGRWWIRGPYLTAFAACEKNYSSDSQMKLEMKYSSSLEMNLEMINHGFQTTLEMKSS